MTNMRRRVKIARVVIAVYGIRTGYWALMIDVIRMPAAAVIAMAKLTRLANRRRFKKLERAAEQYQERARVISSELGAFNRSTELRKQQLLAERAALIKEGERLQSSVSNFHSYGVPGSASVLVLFAYAKTSANKKKLKAEALKRIIERIDNDNFYWDLVIWFVVPSGYGEALLGDLNEEFVLRQSTEGEANARAWYRNQVVATVKEIIWKKIERLAAIGGLIDLVARWFKQ